MIKSSSNQDKSTERDRYDARAKGLVSVQAAEAGSPVYGSLSVSKPLRAPYTFFEKQVHRFVKPGSMVLELGSGTGMHTGVLLMAGGNVVASDISKNSLEVLRNRYQNENILTKIADMESLPFEEECFDVVTSAGSLSYGDSFLVMKEVHRVLKPGGFFICVDSLNNNPIYRLNRLVHYFRGERTLSTLKRMPSIETIDRYSLFFSLIELEFFGAISWLANLLSRFFGDENATNISHKVDHWLNVKRAAFKFVMVVRKDT